MTTFGKKLRELREGRELSQAELARRVKLSQGYISHIEQGSRPPPTPEVLQHLVMGLELSNEDRDNLAQLAAASKSELQAQEQPPPPKLILDTVEEERERQAKAEVVWVVAKSPLEITNTDYMNLVATALFENRCNYVYWTSQASEFDSLREDLEVKLTQLIARETDSGEGALSDARKRIVERVICFDVPSSATWFSFVLYDPHKSSNQIVSAFLSIEEASKASGYINYVLDILDNEATARALADLRSVFDAFAGSQDRKIILRDGIWKKHFPGVET